LATQSEPDQWGQFRTPSLRNVANTAPYMHQGQLNTLEQVIAFYSTLDGAISLDHHSESVLKPLQLSPQESRDLLVFLQSLSGKIANSK
jgi:cytochrome c peroxidase